MEHVQSARELPSYGRKRSLDARIAKRAPGPGLIYGDAEGIVSDLRTYFSNCLGIAQNYQSRIGQERLQSADCEI
jgi:hypothetical protein